MQNICNARRPSVRNKTNTAWSRGALYGLEKCKEVNLGTKRVEARPRERLMEAAYHLFSKDGVSQVGIDTILAKSGCAKASLYANFKTKVELAVAFLDRREDLWTRGWLESEIRRRASSPEARLLAIFDVFDGWFHKKSFEGCSFINVLLESKTGSPIRRAAAIHLAKIRAIVRGLAEEARLQEPERFAQAWHMLMKGSIVSAGEGNRNAARDAKYAAELILQNWQREREGSKRRPRRGSPL
ncbi:MAG TPA: TetR/AcrR family transcriptional regulator [Bradyrhizobium sp.]|nr:TetR/AcrR family transcriptional regulator [Bradyrhizobium sp.]